MSANPTAEQLLATVEASPKAVAAHDRTAWVDLFAEGATVEDPVGSRPHSGRAALEKFYDTFIGPNEIAFEVDHDVVSGMTVFRDLTIKTTMSTGVTLPVPMHLRYDVAERDGALKIRALRAHWELPGMITQLLGSGVPGLAAGMKLGPQLIGNQGVGGALGFMGAMKSVGAPGKRAAATLLDAASRGDAAGVRAVLAPVARLEWHAGDAMSVEDFVTRAARLRWRKPIAAGRTVTATIESRDVRGIAELDFAERGNRIQAVRVYLPR